ncbi:MAG: hypothetical protein HGA33_03005 [Candidatus Moranbacteria bacterium]|nr:hypothetical protein [Candidatus Moranbacteria bacterium]
MLERELMEIGLNEKEAKVYLASLELGQSVVQAIANKAGVNRATTYFVIEGLMAKGLMSSFHQGKKQFFIATDPDRLVEILEEQERDMKRKSEELKKLIPQLQSINNKKSDRPVVRYYEGKEGISAMNDELIKIVSGSVVPMAYSVDAVDNLFMKEERARAKKKRLDKKIKTKAIYTYKDGVLESTTDGDRRKVPFEKFPIKSDIAIFDDNVRIASLGNRQVGIIIEDKEIADSMRAVLDLAWEGAKNYQE